MRQLLVICAIFVQLLGYSSAEAKATIQSGAGSETKAAYAIGSFFHEDHPSDITGSSFSGHIAFKIRYQRTTAYMADWYREPELTLVCTDAGSGAYASPLYIPLIRLLLFPNHYFW